MHTKSRFRLVAQAAFASQILLSASGALAQPAPAAPAPAAPPTPPAQPAPAPAAPPAAAPQQPAPAQPPAAPAPPPQAPPAPPAEPAPAAPPAGAAPAPTVPPGVEEPPAARENPAVPGEPVPGAAAAVPGEDAEKTPAPGTSDKALSDVVVTAQKREERAQDVPTPITVASGKRLLDENISSSNDIERISPNLSGQASGSRNSRPRWFLRGIGTNDPSLNLESPIGIYQDEVFIAYVPLQSFPLFDLERVEVLKGPQGTLWGKNTTGGALHFVSRKPTFDPSGYARGTVGTYGLKGAEAAYGGPVVGDWLAARAAFSYEEQEGWAKNIRDGSKDPKYSDFASRLQLLANLGDDVDVLLAGRFRVLTGGAGPSYPVGVGPGGSIQQYPTAPTTYTPSYGTNPAIKDDQFRGPAANQLQSHGATGTVNWHIGDYTVTSISAIDRATNDSSGFSYWPDINFDQTGSYSAVESRQITQELRLTSPQEDRLSWIAGFHYFNWNLFSNSASAIFGPFAQRKNYNDNRFLQNNISYAGFASAKFKFTEAAAVTVGARYTYDKKYVSAQRLNGTGAEVEFLDQGNWQDPSRVDTDLTVVNISPQKGWSQLTYDITPEYRFSKDILAFARFAKGFRAGTYNPTILPANAERGAVLPLANPEILYDLEFGLKTSTLKNRLVANVALFHYWLENVQLNVQQPNPNGLPNANGSSVQNAASGRVLGAELEVEALPVDRFRLRTGLGLLKAEYTDFLTYQGAETVDASGNAFYRTPQFSGTFGGDYTFPVSKESAVGVGTDWIVRSLIYHNAVIQNDPVQTTPAYAIGNAEVRFITGKGRFTIQGFVRNLTDTNYKVLSQVVSGGAYPTSLGNPRTFGLQFIAQL